LECLHKIGFEEAKGVEGHQRRSSFAPDFYDDGAQVLNADCKKWLLEAYEEEEVTLQKITSNHKKFKKHLTDEYELWEQLNGIALSEIYDSCTHSIHPTIDWKEEKCCRGVETAGEQFLQSPVSPQLSSRS
jgi:hypothetical protein